MLTVDRNGVMKTARLTGWDLKGHVERVYDTFRFRRGTPPKLHRRSGESRPAIQQSLMDWNADLGARHRMDWLGFFRRHQAILKPLAKLPRLGKLQEGEMDIICAVVRELEGFKHTSGRRLVFGSKAAHFHFPGLVPVMSSEVEDGLVRIERVHRADVRAILQRSTPPFRFSSPETRAASYRNYVALGNGLLRDVDSRSFFGKRSSATYDLHAKIFEWWIIATADV